MSPKELLSCVERDIEIVFIDEVGFNQDLAPLYGYSKVGTKCSYSKLPKSNNFSVTAAMSTRGLIGFQIFKRSVKGADFCGFYCKFGKLSPNLRTDEVHLSLR